MLLPFPGFKMELTSLLHHRTYKCSHVLRQWSSKSLLWHSVQCRCKLGNFLAAGTKESLQIWSQLCSQNAQALDIVTEKETHKFLFCKISFNTCTVACGFCFFSPNVAKIMAKIRGSKPLFSFFLSSTYHWNKVRKHLTKQGKSTFTKLFYENGFDQF